jgi:hypothetical protein
VTARAPDYAAPVSGWRTWLIDASGAEARLRSVVRAAPWPVGEPTVAECPGVTFAHRPPGPTCRCGIHAARAVEEAAFHAELPSRARQPLAIGLVALWGRVVEGEAGWRAEAAYPQSLHLPLRRPDDRELLEAIAWDLTAYGVPVALLDCVGRGVADALRAATPAARAPLPRAIAA